MLLVLLLIFMVGSETECNFRDRKYTGRNKLELHLLYKSVSFADFYPARIIHLQDSAFSSKQSLLKCLWHVLHYRIQNNRSQREAYTFYWSFYWFFISDPIQLKCFLQKLSGDVEWSALPNDQLLPLFKGQSQMLPPLVKNKLLLWVFIVYIYVQIDLDSTMLNWIMQLPLFEASKVRKILLIMEQKL